MYTFHPGGRATNGGGVNANLYLRFTPEDEHKRLRARSKTSDAVQVSADDDDTDESDAPDDMAQEISDFMANALRLEVAIPFCLSRLKASLKNLSKVFKGL